MTNRDCALLAFKLVGLWFMASALIGAASIASYWEPQFAEMRSMSIAFTLLPALVSLGIGVPLWFSADWFAARVFPDGTGGQVHADRLRADALFALALAVMGVFFVCDGIPQLVNAATLFGQSRLATRGVLGVDHEQQRLIWSSAAKANTLAGVARLLIGIALLLGPSRLAVGYSRVRREMSGSLSETESSSVERSE